MSKELTLEEIGAAISDGKIILARAETELKALHTQYKEKGKELQELGINPETAEADLKRMTEEFTKKKQELEALIPLDIIAQYKQQ